MEANIANTMEVNFVVGLAETTSIHPTEMGSLAWRVDLPCDTTN
jgi:hypothetical protein